MGRTKNCVCCLELTGGEAEYKRNRNKGLLLLMPNVVFSCFSQTYNRMDLNFEHE